MTEDLESCKLSRRKREEEADEEEKKLAETEANLMEVRRKRDQLRNK